MLLVWQTRLSAKLECPVWVSICVTGKRQISVDCGYRHIVLRIAGGPHRRALSSWGSTHMNRRHLCSLLAALAATVAIDAMAADPPMTAKEPRFPQFTVEQLNEQQKPLGEQIMKVSSVGLAGPYNPLLRSPVLGQRMFDLLYYLRWNTSVPLRLNEFAILIIGRQWRSQVEWFAHAPLAIKAGLSPEILADLKA